MGIIVKDIMDIMEEIASPRLAEPWDNVGLLAGSSAASVSRVMVTLDITDEVIKNAVEKDVDLIISHHPIIFKSLKTINDESATGSLLLKLMKAGISVYSAHTNYDKAPGGVDDTLAEVLGLNEVRPLAAESYCIEPCQPYFGRIGILPEKQPLKDYLLTVKKSLNTEISDYIGDPNREIQVVASCAGAGGEFINKAISAGADLFITGEAKYHEALQVLESDMALATFGHYATELPAMAKLIGRLQKAVDELQYKVDIIPSKYYGNYFRRL